MAKKHNLFNQRSTLFLLVILFNYYTKIICLGHIRCIKLYELGEVLFSTALSEYLNILVAELQVKKISVQVYVCIMV